MKNGDNHTFWGNNKPLQSSEIPQSESKPSIHFRMYQTLSLKMSFLITYGYKYKNYFKKWQQFKYDDSRKAYLTVFY